MNASELERMVNNFIDEQGIVVDFPESDLDTKVALVKFARTVLEDAEKAEGIIARGKLRNLKNVTLTIKWSIGNELKLRKWLAKMLIRLAVIVLGCDIAFEQEENNDKQAE